MMDILLLGARAILDVAGPFHGVRSPSPGGYECSDGRPMASPRATGDADCDSEVSVGDINPFVALRSGP